MKKVLNIGSSSVLVELGETDQYPLLKVDKAAETVTHLFHFFNSVVNPLNHARCEPMSEVVQYIFFPLVEHMQKVVQMLVFHFRFFEDSCGSGLEGPTWTCQAGQWLGQHLYKSIGCLRITTYSSPF